MNKLKSYFGKVSLTLLMIRMITKVFITLGVITSIPTYSQEYSYPEVGEWEYFSANCSHPELGPFDSVEEAAQASLDTYWTGCPDAKLKSFSGWPVASNPTNGLCGSTNYRPGRFDYIYGVQRSNASGYYIEYCGSNASFPVRKQRKVTCKDNQNQISENCQHIIAKQKNLTSTCFKNPISIETGNKTETVIDYQGVRGLRIARTYNSVTGRWRFNFEVQVEEAVITFVTRVGGDKLAFVYRNSQYIPYTDSTVQFRKKFDGVVFSGWVLDLENGTTQNFDTAGRIASLDDKSGIVLTYDYNELEELERISNNLGEEIFVDWQKDKVASISVPGSLQYQYKYDENGNLSKRTEIEGTLEKSSVTYHYEDPAFPNALTGISDEKNVRYSSWTYDSEGRANSSQHANGVDQGTVDYTHIDDQNDPRVTTTNEFGKQTTYHYQIIAGERKKVSVEGHQSDNCAAANKNYTYYPSGLLETKTDWKNNTTSYQYNTRNLESSRTEALGTPLERTITTEWHPTFNLRTKVTEPGRETNFIYDAQGRLLSRSSNEAPPN